MALSLKCGQCGVLLRSVAEAQSHGEATGHSQFEETTEAIKLMVCADCGKPCRTDAERDLHSRHTGHKTFNDKVSDKVVNTEKEMAAARQEAMEVDGVGASGSAGEAAAGGEAGAGDAGASGRELVPAEVDPAQLKELTESMGFPEARAVRALHFSGGTTIEAAVTWLVDHEGDPDIDEPLLVPKSEAKPKLTPEEARKKAEELVRRAKEKREKEERDMERKRELERIRAGKEIQAAQRMEKELEMKRIVEQRRLEKEEEARAREKLRLKLEEDRKERRRKLGLPEELTEEEKAREAERLEKERQAAEAKKAAFVAQIKPVSVMEKMRAQLVGMKKNMVAVEGDKAGDEKFKTACTVLSKYVANVGKSPDEEKFRSIKLTNAVFQQKVSSVPGAIEFLEQCGFKRDASGEVLTLAREAVSMDVLTSAASELNDALTNPFFGAL